MLLSKCHRDGGEKGRARQSGQGQAREPPVWTGARRSCRLCGRRPAWGAGGRSGVLVSCTRQPGQVAPGWAEPCGTQCGERRWERAPRPLSWEQGHARAPPPQSYFLPSIISDSVHGFLFSNLTFKFPWRYEVLEGMLSTQFKTKSKPKFQNQIKSHWKWAEHI